MEEDNKTSKKKQAIMDHGNEILRDAEIMGFIESNDYRASGEDVFQKKTL